MFIQALRKAAPLVLFGQMLAAGAGYWWHGRPAEQTFEKRQPTDSIINDAEPLRQTRAELGWIKSGYVGYDTAEALSRKLAGEHDRIFRRVVLEGSEADFAGMIFHVEMWSDLPTPAYVAKLEGNGSFLEECRAKLPGKSAEEIVFCATGMIEQNRKEAYAIGGGVAGTFTILPLCAAFASGLRRRREEEKQNAEADARAKAAKDEAEKYKTDLEALKKLISPKS